MSEEQSKRIHCNRCGGDTNHVLRGSHKQAFHDDEWGYWEESKYNLWTCAGCDSAVLESRWTDASMQDNKGQQYLTDYFPPREANSLKVKPFRKIPRKLQEIYKETVRAFNFQLFRLCAGGLRSLIEGICADKNIEGRNLEKRIDGLVPLLPENIVRNLHGFRFMGNEALHELAQPKQDDLRLAIEVSEDLLNFLYDLDYKAAGLPKKAVKDQQA